MIEWLRRVEPDRPFLHARERSWSYGETLAEVEARVTPSHRFLQPLLQPDSVFEVIAALSSGGITVGGSHGDLDPGADLVVFTSGTTGPPKGVRLTLGNLEAAARASVAHLGHGPDDTWLLAMPLHHVGGLSILVRQAFSGGAVRLEPVFEPTAFAEALGRGVTMVSVVPTMLLRLTTLGPFQGLRAVLVGGGPIPDGLLEEAAAAGMPVLPTYGMTETFGQVATLRPGAPLERKTHPLPGIELRIENDGRIAVRGAQVSPGYLGEPDREDPWFVTNDLGVIDDEGALRVLGRSDTVIVTGGENVNPEQVEAVLRQHGAIEDVVVFGVPDDEWGELVVCVYEGDATADELASWSSERLQPFMVPRSWHKAPIPRTSLGKPDREALSRFGERG